MKPFERIRELTAEASNSDTTSPTGPVFLGLDKPPLVSATEWLLDQFQQESEINLSALVLVVPGARARIRLLQRLVEAADNRSSMLTPPRIITVGNFPELLYPAEKELATDLAQQIAWSKALEGTPEDEIKCLTGRTDIDELDDWQPLAKLLSKLHRRLANDVWSFRSVAREVKKLKGFLKQETQRWDVLESIQRRYYEQLTSVDLWDRQAARNVSIHRNLCSTDKQIVLVGIADLNNSVRRMLQQIAPRVTPLVAATPDMADRFDEFGNLITEQWLHQDIDIPDNRILVVDRPDDQAFAAAHFISNLDVEVASDEITIGAPDEQITPQLERSLKSIGLRHRNLAGLPLSLTTPVRLMIACREYLAQQDFDSFASLVRHPDMYRWLGTKCETTEWLGELSIYQNEKLPSRIGLKTEFAFGDPAQIAQDFDAHDKSGQRRAERKSKTTAMLNSIHAAIASLLDPLTGEAQPIANWTQPWNQILVQIYADREVDPNSNLDRQTIKACDAIYEALGDHHQIPVNWQTNVTAATALDMALEAATDSRVVEPPISDAVEIAGWLDLMLDDAPVMVITGMNDEHVPATETGHQFLPNKLCEQLGIEDNRRRFARDVYALTVINAVRSDLLLIMGRHNENNEPKKPSRLFFATDQITAARRAQAFFSYSGKHSARFWLTKESEFSKEQLFEIPKPSGIKPITSLTVTSFKEFLKCPYRFYLGKVLRLETFDDNLRELSGGLFGDLAHNVLEAFGRDSIRKQDRAGEIQTFLNDELSAAAQKVYGGSRLPSVRIQIEQLRLRLNEFALHQAEYRRLGWLIVSVEEMLYHELMVDGTPFEIRGKIDRVDRNELDDRVAIWDYKTSDRGDSPGFAHYGSRNGWKDLQLPLYRYLVREVAAVKDCDLSDVSLGYVLLPKQIDQIGFSATDWDSELLKTADEEAFNVIRTIRESTFWPPTKNPPQFSEDYAAICQDNVFERFEIRNPENEDTTEVMEAPF